MVSKKHLFSAATQLALTCISIEVAGSTGIEVVAEFAAAEACAGAISAAIVSAPALAAASRFIAKNLSRRYSS
ncbi:hypothetical protein MAGR_59430 [Mycolicibacterium agri]|uniref:Uncharacterized protein n=1 Tax=Mycolicibacterium agri TaxID=36811 RepID=A0A7I9W9X2_MYCAG|nr:hypothetical protein MAGR_59430 [Mycolicibacterium agri]